MRGKSSRADGVVAVPGIKGAVWVPNQFNNPIIDANGKVTFRCQIGGTGITTANNAVVMSGDPTTLSLIARNGSAVPGGIPKGYVINTTAGINGLGTANNGTADGGFIVAGNINGAGVVATTDSAMFFVNSAGTASLMVRESDVYPGGGGSVISSAMTGSAGQQTNTAGSSIFSATLLGGDVSGTTNNTAVVVLSSSGATNVFRKGAAAPGFADGTTMTLV